MRLFGNSVFLLYAIPSSTTRVRFLIANITAFINAPPVLRSFDFPPHVAAHPPTMIAFLLFQLILSPVESIVSIGINAISRKFEWEADRFACELQDKLSEPGMKDMGDRLAKALITLHVENLSTVWVDWLCVFFVVFVNFLCFCH